MPSGKDVVSGRRGGSGSNKKNAFCSFCRKSYRDVGPLVEGPGDAIGVAEPTSIMVDTFGTGKITDERITQLVREHFDLRPYGILKMLDLLNAEQIKYRKTAAYGHFGREDADFSWERTDRAEALRADAGL